MTFEKIAYPLVLAVVICTSIVGCCGGDQKKAAQDKEPVLVCEKDGVKLWKVKSYYNDSPSSGYNWVYFTTPTGDVHWREQQGKTTVEKQVPGVAK